MGKISHDPASQPRGVLGRGLKRHAFPFDGHRRVTRRHSVDAVPAILDYPPYKLPVSLSERNLARRERLTANRNFAGHKHILCVDVTARFDRCNDENRRYEQSTNCDHPVQ